MSRLLLGTFRPYLLPEFGWIGILLAIVGLRYVTTDRFRQRLKQKHPYVRSTVAVRLLAAIFLSAGGLAGVSLLVEREGLFWIAFGTGSAALIAAAIVLLAASRENGLGEGSDYRLPE